MGQELDADGSLIVNEPCRLIAENDASGDENEESTAAGWGSLDDWSIGETPSRWRNSRPK